MKQSGGLVLKLEPDHLLEIVCTHKTKDTHVPLSSSVKLEVELDDLDGQISITLIIIVQRVDKSFLYSNLNGS